MVDRTVVFLSYYGHQAKIFKPMSSALAGQAASRHLSIYPLTLERVLCSAYRRDSVPEDTCDGIIEYYLKKKSCLTPDLDTPAFRARLKKRACEWYTLFRRKLAGADALVVWNGFSIPLASAVEAAKSLDIKMIFCENAVLPGMIAMDPQGINFLNCISGKTADFYRSLEIDPEKASELSAIALGQRPVRKAKKKNVMANCDDGKPLPDRYVLFAMQVHDDTQIVLFSHRFRNLPDAVRYTWERIQEYNARTGDNLALVVKEHPSDFGRVDYSELRASLPDVLFLRSTPVVMVVPRAQALITLNSTVGVEALLHKCPVITLADAFYNVEGVVHHVGPSDDLADALYRAINDPQDTDLVERFLYFLRYEYLVPTPVLADGTKSYSAAAQRIVDIMDDRLAWTR